MSNPTCPVHKTPLLPEGKDLLFCPDCDYTITRKSLGDAGKRPKRTMLVWQQDGRRKKAI